MYITNEEKCEIVTENVGVACRFHKESTCYPGNSALEILEGFLGPTFLSSPSRSR